MPRILTAETSSEVVAHLKKVAIDNKRSAGKEALIAIEAHIQKHRELAKRGPLTRKQKP